MNPRVTTRTLGRPTPAMILQQAGMLALALALVLALAPARRGARRRARELRRPRRAGQPGGGQHHHHHDDRRPGRRHAPDDPRGLALRGFLPRLHGPPARTAARRRPAARRPRSVRASSSPRTATSSPTTTSSRAPTRSRSNSSRAEARRQAGRPRPQTDIALLKVESDEPLPFVSFGDTDLMRVGDWVLAIGNPLGQGFSVSAGIVSARNRDAAGQL